MAELTEDFLSGQGVPVALGEIESKLAELWGPAADLEGGPEVENPTLTRVVLANLVVVTDLADAARIDAVLPTVETRYPCRAILVVLNDDPDRKVKAEVSALCHLPVPGLPQVCSERIVLSAGPNAVDLLPGAIRPLLESDLPFILWWANDPRKFLHLLTDLADEASRILVDLPDPATEPEAVCVGLEPKGNPYSRDIAWFAITRWRELTAQFFDAVGTEAELGELTSVTIDVASASAARAPRVACWLAGWMAGQLGWLPRSRKDLGPGSIEAVFTKPDDQGDVVVSIRTSVDPTCDLARLTAVRMKANGPERECSYLILRSGNHGTDVRIESKGPGRCPQPRNITVKRTDSANRVAAALESAREDPPFTRARPFARWLFDPTTTPPSPVL